MQRRSFVGFEQLLCYLYAESAEVAARAKMRQDVKKSAKGSQLKAQDDGG